MSGDVGLSYHVSEERARPPAARRYRSMAAKKRAELEGREIAISSLGDENERARKNKWIGWRSARSSYLLLLHHGFMVVFMSKNA